MRNIATCYSEHAVRVSDSYCSGPLNKTSYVTSPNKSIPSIQNAVSHTYKAKLSAEKRIFITITWCSKLICQGFFLKISNNNNNNKSSKTHQMAKPRGSKCLENLNNDTISKVQVYWDLSNAKFEAGPAPLESYYIIVVLVDSQETLVIGDMVDDPIVKELITSNNNKHDETHIPKNITLVSQYEHCFTRGKYWSTQISSTAKFCGSGSQHEIMIKCGPDHEDGSRSPGLSIFVDKKRVVRVKKLQWNFRGNQVIFVDGLLVDVMWDVFGWYFDDHHQNQQQQQQRVVNKDVGGGCGLFMFRTRSGLDSRLWLEEEEKKLADKNPDKPDFTLLICASSNNPG